MSGCSDYFHSPQALEIDRRNLKKYDTSDLEEIERIKKHKDKCVEEEVDKKLQNALQNALPAIQEQERENARKVIREEYRLAEGVKIYGLSQFISESVTNDGEELFPNNFIPDRPVNESISEDNPLYFDDKSDEWRLFVKNGKTKLISRFVVIACLIVDASGPGSCRAYVVFLKGETKPLIFWDGIIDAPNLRRQTQFHQRGLSYGRKDLYHESFLRALSMCKAVYFLTLPRHAGWNATPDGRLSFVSAAMDIPLLASLFGDGKGQLRNVARDIIMNPTERTLESIVTDFHNLLPDAIPIKIVTVISAMSRLLPHYKAEGLVQDRLWVVETADEATAKAIVAVMQNRNHRTTEVLFSSMRLPHIKDELMKYVDCVAVMRHSCAICSMYDFDKILKYLYELIQNGYSENNNSRLIPTLFIDNAGIIPEEFLIHQVSIGDRLCIDDYEPAQRILGELDYRLVKYAEHNPDSMAQRLGTAITEAKGMASVFPRRSQSNSAVMFLSTALLLKAGGILTDDDVEAMLKWLSTEAKDRTSVSRGVCKTIGTTFSEVICSGRLLITKQYGPPFWTADSAFVAADDSINVTKDTLDDVIFTDISVGRNTALQYLLAEEVLFKDKESKGGQKTWTVETKDGVKKPRRFYSFTRDFLTSEANRIVDEAVASDLFHKPDKHIDHFFPFIKHSKLDMFAGQVVTDYKHGNTFIDVTGTPGAGKSTWMMMQVLQRVEADDLVVVLDPTNSFCREELIAHKIPTEIIDRSFTFWDMSTQGWPVNILDFEGCDDMTQRVQRLSSLLISGMHLIGMNQKAIVMTKTEEWLQKYEIDKNHSIFKLSTSFRDNADERKIGVKLSALFSTVKEVKNGVEPPGWEKLLSKRGNVLVISAGSATINGYANPFDILLDTLYSFKDKHKEGAITLILDEVQTLNHYRKSTLVKILSRVRKDNVSVILASQDYQNASLEEVYKYCGTHILFRPLGDEGIEAVAELTKLNSNVIRTLPDFHCAVIGCVYSKHYQKNIQLSSAIVGETYRPPYVGSFD